MVHQVRLFSVKTKERNRSMCSLCLGHKRLCGKSLCPILTKAETLMGLERRLSREKIFGSSPPAVFVGSWNYPKVLAGPLVPPVSVKDTAVMDLPELWVDKTFSEILGYRLALVRGKRLVNVRSAAKPEKTLSTFPV